MSNRWSCATLGEGFQQVMAETLHDEKAKLLAEVKETLPGSFSMCNLSTPSILCGLSILK